VTDAIRTRLPGVSDTVTSGELARDASQQFGKLPPLQFVEVLGQDYFEPLFVRMQRPPKMVLCGVKNAKDDQAIVGFNAAVEFTWRGNGIDIRRIQGLTPGSGVLYNFAFLGVG
jgi:hypothetical protein